ncbi:MAG: hypothetical protein BM555_03510 [Crocinitomix sp. MedPE-SWsnd]|nr:MAG: hypothetical protein BM555_03510 [Crocinitomix sp. MedPE-SWsnd]
MIQISYDCPESVSDMPKTECGLFCQTCSKNIHDFRGKSLDEISKIRIEDPTISCGVFDSTVAQSDSRTTVQNFFRIAFAAIFVLGFNVTTLFSQTVDNLDTSVKYTEVVAESAFVMGEITNHHNRPLQAKVTYTVKGMESVEIEVTKDGKFEFQLDREHLGKKVYLVVAADGFYTKYLTIEALSTKCHTFEVQMTKAKKYRGRRRGHTAGVIAGYF